MEVGQIHGSLDGVLDKGFARQAHLAVVSPISEKEGFGDELYLVFWQVFSSFGE